MTVSVHLSAFWADPMTATLPPSQDKIDGVTPNALTVGIGGMVRANTGELPTPRSVNVATITTTMDAENNCRLGPLMRAVFTRCPHQSAKVTRPSSPTRYHSPTWTIPSRSPPRPLQCQDRGKLRRGDFPCGAGRKETAGLAGCATGMLGMACFGWGGWVVWMR